MKVRSFSIAALIVAGGILLGRALGFLREILLARFFGVSGQMDALVIALTLPQALSNALIGGPAAVAIIPVLTKLRSSADNFSFRRTIHSLLFIAACVGIALSLTGYFQSANIIHLMVPGLRDSERVLAIKCTKIAFIGLPFTMLAYVCMPVLQTLKRFSFPSLATALFNLVLISAIILLASRYGVVGVAWGTVMAALCRWILQEVGLFQERLMSQPSFSISDQNVTRIIYLIGPAIIAYGGRDMMLVIDRYFASSLAPGCISALNYADRLIQFPIGFFAGAVCAAIFPFLSESIATGNMPSATSRMRSGLKSILVTLVPVALLTFFLSDLFVTLLLKRGAFDAQAVGITSRAASIFALGMPFQGIAAFLMIVLYSFEKSFPPMIIVLITIICHIIMNILLVPRMDYLGLAVSTSASYVIMTTLCAFEIRRSSLPSLSVLKKDFAFIVLAGLIMSGGLLVIRPWIMAWQQSFGIPILVQQIVAICTAGILVYIAVLSFLMPQHSPRKIWAAIRNGQF